MILFRVTREYFPKINWCCDLFYISWIIYTQVQYYFLMRLWLNSPRMKIKFYSVRRQKLRHWLRSSRLQKTCKIKRWNYQSEENSIQYSTKNEPLKFFSLFTVTELALYFFLVFQLFRLELLIILHIEEVMDFYDYYVFFSCIFFGAALPFKMYNAPKLNKRSSKGNIEFWKW